MAGSDHLLLERPEPDLVSTDLDLEAVITFRQAARNSGRNRAFSSSLGASASSVRRPHEHVPGQALEGKIDLRRRVREVPEQEVVDLVLIVMRGEAVDDLVGRFELEPVARQARQELEGEVRRPDPVLDSRTGRRTAASGSTTGS